KQEAKEWSQLATAEREQHRHRDLLRLLGNKPAKTLQEESLQYQRLRPFWILFDRYRSFSRHERKTPAYFRDRLNETIRIIEGLLSHLKSMDEATRGLLSVYAER